MGEGGNRVAPPGGARVWGRALPSRARTSPRASHGMCHAISDTPGRLRHFDENLFPASTAGATGR